MAKGDYIWIAESDDLANPDLLNTLVSVLDKNKNVGLAYCQSFYINADNMITGNHIDELEKYDYSLWRNDFVENGIKMLSSHMAAINIIPNASSLLFRKRIYEQVGGADEYMKLCGDWLTWSKMLMISDLAFIAKPLNYFRMHELSVRSHIHSTRRYILEYLYVVKNIFKNVSIYRHSKNSVIYQLKARWFRLAIEHPKEISFQLTFLVFRKINLLLGIWQAFQFLLIGSLSITHINFRDSSKVKSVLKVLRKLTLKHAGSKVPAVNR